MKFKKEQKIAMLEEKMVILVIGAARWGVRVVLRRSGNCRKNNNNSGNSGNNNNKGNRTPGNNNNNANRTPGNNNANRNRNLGNNNANRNRNLGNNNANRNRNLGNNNGISKDLTKRSQRKILGSFDVNRRVASNVVY